MFKKQIALAGALTSVMLAAPMLPPQVQAQPREGVCLAYPRIAAWRVLDERTILVVDRDDRPFTVRLRDNCTALTRATRNVSFRPSNTTFACLRADAIIAYLDPDAGAQTCVVDSVRPGFPENYLLLYN